MEHWVKILIPSMRCVDPQPRPNTEGFYPNTLVFLVVMTGWELGRLKVRLCLKTGEVRRKLLRSYGRGNGRMGPQILYYKIPNIDCCRLLMNNEYIIINAIVMFSFFFNIQYFRTISQLKPC